MKKQKLLNNIMKNFEGLKKVEAFDIISKLETLLFYAPNPLNFENIDTVEVTNFQNDTNMDPFQFTLLPNGNICEFKGCNDFLHLYKEHKRFLPDWRIFSTYYYKSKYAPLEMIKLTKQNFKHSFKGTSEEKRVEQFLLHNKVIARDLISKRLLLLDNC